jgi:hypothetical protein
MVTCCNKALQRITDLRNRAFGEPVQGRPIIGVVHFGTRKRWFERWARKLAAAWSLYSIWYFVIDLIYNAKCLWDKGL